MEFQYLINNNWGYPSVNHGGDDPGTIGNGITEKEYNLMISKYMYDRFSELGIPVYITRNSDETLAPEQRVDRILDAYGNSPNVIVISNHVNAGGGEGAEVIYALRNNSNLSVKVLDELAKEGQVIRDAYQRRLPSDTTKDYYFIHRETGLTEPIIVEYGFVDTEADATRLKANAENYAEATVRAVLDYIEYIPSSGNTYKVQAGDSLYSIAKKFNISVEELKAENNLTSNLISIGQVLKIPVLDEPAGDYVEYIVKAGDSLYAIARDFKTTVDDIMEYNNLTSTALSIGQILLIPTEKLQENEYETYTVKAGDSLYSIANAYETTVDEITRLNNLSSNLLSIGQKLLIPKTDSLPEENEVLNYKVVAGDSLYSIARKYNTTVNEIKQLNNMTSDLLDIGQILKIPVQTNEIEYIVKAGDSLYSIAKKYNTTVDSIINKNNLTSTLLSIGQKLII